MAAVAQLPSALLSAAKEVDWAGEGDESDEIHGARLQFWASLSDRSFTAISAWCSVQNDSTTQEVDVCSQTLEYVVSTLSEAKFVHVYPSRLVVKIVETLPEMDVILMQTKSLHFKLMSLVWKGIYRLVQGGTANRLQLLRADYVLKACLTRAVNNVGRSQEEEKKIRAFFLSQLTRLVFEKLPNRSGCFSEMFHTLFDLNRMDPGCADQALTALCRDELFSVNQDMVQTCQQDTRIFQLVLRSNPGVLIPQCIPHTHTHFNILADLMPPVENADAKDLLSSLFACTNAIEFALRCVHVLRIQSSHVIWAQAALQGLTVHCAKRWSNVPLDDEDAKVTMLSMLAWRLDFDIAMHVVMSSASFPNETAAISLYDCARISFLKLAPAETTLPNKMTTMCAALEGMVTPGECSRLGRAGKRALLYTKMEVACVLGRFGSKQTCPDLLSSALIAFEHVPEIALEALCSNTRSFQSAQQLLKAFDVCRPHYSTGISGWSCWLGSLAAAPCLQRPNNREDSERIAKEIIVLFSVCAEGASMVGREDAFSRLADLFALGEFPKLRDLVPAKFKQEFVEYLRNNRQSKAIMLRSPCAFEAIQHSLPLHPPASSAITRELSEETEVSNTGGEDVEESLDRVKRLCCRIPLHELIQFENRLLQVVQTEKSKRST